MAELLSREKEFRKLNEQLDQLANTALEESLQPQQQQQQQLPLPPTTASPQKQPLQQPQTQQPPQRPPNPLQQQPNQQPKNRQQPQSVDRSVCPKTESKYYTFIKNKQGCVGIPTTMKKRGAGDAVSNHIYSGIVPPPPPPLNRMAIDRSAASVIRGGDMQRSNRYKTSAAPSNATNSTNVQSARPSNAEAASLRATTPPREMSSISTAVAAAATTASMRSSQRSHRNCSRLPESARTCSRVSHRSSNASNSGGAFSVRYRNPKFVESPSLEVLVKDEAASVRQQQSLSMSCSHNGTNVESLLSGTSSLSAEAGGKSARPSQESTRRHISTEGLIKFLKSKIVILEEDHDRISQEMAQQKELLEKTLERQKQIEQQRDQAFAKQSSIAELLSKTESKLDEANRRVKERTAEQTAQQKEIEVVKREIKMFTQTNSNLEKRLMRANEELESTKHALAAMKASEREERESMRAECEGKDKQIRSLRKQRADLLNAYKKQLFLIDNLKRQTLCLEQSKMIDFNEKEFSKVLDWNSKT